MQAAIVLCGGKSTRMGASKALLPFGQEAMLQRVVRIAREAVTSVVVVAGRDQSLPELPPGVIVTRDERPDRGPLEGLRAGLKALPAAIDAAYLTSCDVPLLESAFVRQMFDFVDGHDAAVVEIDGFAHPLAGVYRRTVLPYVEELLAANRLRLASLLDHIDTRRVQREEITTDPDVRMLRNVNTREDYARALAEAGLHP